MRLFRPYLKRSGLGDFKRKKLPGKIIRSPHKFEPFWQQVYNKCPPTYNTGAENVPKKASDKVGMYDCGIVSFLIREGNSYFEELFQNLKKSVSQFVFVFN